MATGYPVLTRRATTTETASPLEYLFIYFFLNFFHVSDSLHCFFSRPSVSPTRPILVCISNERGKTKTARVYTMIIYYIIIQVFLNIHSGYAASSSRLAYTYKKSDWYLYISCITRTHTHISNIYRYATVFFSSSTL